MHSFIPLDNALWSSILPSRAEPKMELNIFNRLREVNVDELTDKTHFKWGIQPSENDDSISFNDNSHITGNNIFLPHGHNPYHIR